MLGDVEVGATVDAFVTDKISETAKNVAASFALVNEVTFVGEKIADLIANKNKFISNFKANVLTVLTSLVPFSYA